MSESEPGQPTWSVMIPTYNPTEHLRIALESVLEAKRQLGEVMQVEIVDDASPAVDVAALVAGWGFQGVTVFRREFNGGLAACWNHCVERSTGDLVHLLHQDDFVAPLFYLRIAEAAMRFPQAGMFCCRNVFLLGDKSHLSPEEQAQTGLVHDWLEKICSVCRVQCPAVVLKRSTYHQAGGFDPSLRMIIDWEMWIRVAAHTPVVYLPEPLATYRVHSGAETRRIRDSAGIADDFARGLKRIQAVLVLVGRTDCMRLAIRYAWDVSGDAAGEAKMRGRPDIALYELGASLRHFGARVGMRLLFERLRWYLDDVCRPKVRPLRRMLVELRHRVAIRRRGHILHERSTMSTSATPTSSNEIHESNGNALPRISVLMPVFNGEHYVGRAIQSILEQSERDVELIVVDDGSTDGTLAILRQHAARDGRIRVVSRGNLGVVATRNEILALARGEFLACMDADDIAEPRRFERELQALIADPKMVAVGCSVHFIDPSDRRLMTFAYPAGHDAIVDWIMAIERGIGISHPSMMMRAAAVSRIGGYREEFFPAEDADLVLRLAEIGRVDNLAEPLLSYRLHSQSIGRLYSERQRDAHFRCVADAAARRGLAAPDEGLRVAKVQATAGDVEWRRRWAWWAIGSGNLRSARSLALEVVVRAPLSRSSWLVMACALRGY